MEQQCIRSELEADYLPNMVLVSTDNTNTVWRTNGLWKKKLKHPDPEHLESMTLMYLCNLFMKSDAEVKEGILISFIKSLLNEEIGQSLFCFNSWGSRRRA